MPRRSRLTGSQRKWGIRGKPTRSGRAARDVGVIEARDQHERAVRVDEPVPRAGRRDDDRTSAQLVDLVAITEQAGADDRERLLAGGRDDRDRPRAWPRAFRIWVTTVSRPARRKPRERTTRVWLTQRSHHASGVRTSRGSRPSCSEIQR